MRALKTSGGLTRGSNMTEKQIALWTMSAPVCSQYNQAMQEFTGKMFETSEQHKETMTCRIKRDAYDSSKVFGKFNDYPPLITYPSLRNIISGMEANPQVNVVEFREVGRRIMDKMVGQKVFSYSFKRKDRAVTMASTTSVKVDEDRSIKSIALFQRLLVVSWTGEVSLSGAMEYELCPFPPSLFESKNLMRAPDKPALMQALAKYIQGEDKDNKAILDSIPITDWYVMDGGSLLHRIKWKPESSYGSIIKSYVKLLDKYGRDNTTIVFDGYDSGPTTKYCIQERRHPCKSNKVHFTLDNIYRGKKERISV
ncbi:hypothetical protein SNE40_021241 [Patella caerulea]|uniref:Uncharacterized protein n=1 Tax=Patella caerulea TaxID=87958 RepID=A0AAN8GIG5_PATCE